jgi:hypothetical protein
MGLSCIHRYNQAYESQRTWRRRMKHNPGSIHNQTSAIEQDDVNRDVICLPVMSFPVHLPEMGSAETEDLKSPLN